MLEQSMACLSSWTLRPPSPLPEQQDVVVAAAEDAHMVHWQDLIAKKLGKVAPLLQGLQQRLTPGLALEPLESAVRSLQTFSDAEFSVLEVESCTFEELKPTVRWGGQCRFQFQGGSKGPDRAAGKLVSRGRPGRGLALQGGRGGGDEGVCGLQRGAAALRSGGRR